MSNKPTDFAPPMSPPPNYSQMNTNAHQGGPSSSFQQQQPFQPPMSPGPHDFNKMTPYDANQSAAIHPPDPTYGGYYNNNPQGPYGPPAQGYYAPGPNPAGYYGQPMPPPGMQQPMYYQQQPVYMVPQQGPYGYYAQDRPGNGGGVCAGILGALACCCCLDMLLF